MTLAEWALLLGPEADDTSWLVFADWWTEEEGEEGTAKEIRAWLWRGRPQQPDEMAPPRGAWVDGETEWDHVVAPYAWIHSSFKANIYVGLQNGYRENEFIGSVTGYFFYFDAMLDFFRTRARLEKERR